MHQVHICTKIRGGIIIIMANASTCNGTIDRDFFNKHAQTIINGLNNMLEFPGYYGFENITTEAIDDNDEYDVVMDFTATGRWSMEDTLPHLFDKQWYGLPAADEKTAKKYASLEKLLDLLAETNEPVIELSYIDSESGTRFIVHQVAEFTGIKSEVTQEEDYDYTLEHIVRYCWMADPDFELTKVKTFDDVADILEANGNSVSLTKEQKQTVVSRIKDDDYLNGYITDNDAEAIWTVDEIIDDVLGDDAADKRVSNNNLPF